MAIKLSVRFWANLLLSFMGGTAASFSICRLTIGATENWFILALIGLGFGAASSGGILFLFPKADSNDGTIGRYAFWPALSLGSALAISSANAKTGIVTFTFSNVAGFVIILALYLWNEFREKKIKSE